MRNARTEEAVKNVVMAIRDSGSVPRWHYRIMFRHRKEWPTLWKALDELISAHENRTHE
jgi:hypothetical protein